MLYLNFIWDIVVEVDVQLLDVGNVQPIPLLLLQLKLCLCLHDDLETRRGSKLSGAENDHNLRSSPRVSFPPSFSSRVTMMYPPAIWISVFQLVKQTVHICKTNQFYCSPLRGRLGTVECFHDVSRPASTSVERFAELNASNWRLSAFIMHSQQCLCCVGWCQGFQLGRRERSGKHSKLSV